jgi:hypothetical protein
VTTGTSTPGLAVPGLAVPGSGGSGSAVSAFTIGFITGDSTSAAQAFAPGGWTTLPAVTASNGVDHTCDVVLTAAWTVTSSPVSVTGTAGTAEDMSGSIIGVQVGAPSPIPEDSGVAPGWAGRTILEAAIGSGFQTPPDEMTWVTLNDSALTPAQQEAAGQPKCFWSWEETSTGIPYALGQLQSSEGNLQLDNASANFTPSNPSGNFYPDITTGTPLRLRFALGTVGGVTQDRWYTWSRNALDWDEKRDEELRSYVVTGLTDSWSVASAPCPSAYRTEIIQDAPQSWWAMDDQPLAGGVLPTQLVNGAAGNSNPLVIYAASGGVSAGDQYSTTGTDLTTDGSGITGIPAANPPPSVAIYSVGANAGWMYGDPQSSPSSYSTGNPVTSSPGAASWQQTGLLGNSGSNGWFMAANDPDFPPLADGMSFELWWNPAFFGSATGFTDTSNSTFVVAGQPYSQITLATLATASNAVAILYLDISGHLILETFNGSSGTATTIYNDSDLRSGSFHQVVITATTTAWTVYVDGGQAALVTGTATGMTSAWDWLIIGADCGTAGGSSLNDATHMGNVAYSHAEVYAGILPYWRVLAHYCAAATGFGVIPAPQTVAASTVVNRLAGVGYTPDGAVYKGSYGSSGSAATSFGFSALAVAEIGSYTSGPSARSAIAAVGSNTSGVITGRAAWASWTGLAPQFTVYTAAAADAETSAGVANGSGMAFTAGYGSGATSAGVCKVSGGTGASPPAGPSALGHTVANRIEWLLAAGGMTAPNRAVDATASELAQAALDVGGQACGANIANQASSDYGLWYVDNCNTLSYRARPHLNSDGITWNLSSAGPEYGIPFESSQDFPNDPQYVINSIQIAPYSPDQASLPVITPASATAAKASQSQYGVRPLSLGTTNYLQSSSEIQSIADWLLSTFGALERRSQNLKVDAARNPSAWGYVLGLNVGDVCQIWDQPLSGGPLSVSTYRVSMIARKVAFGANSNEPEASATITCDPVVTYFS